MAINVGVWIDHHKAVVVRITDQAVAIKQIGSDLNGSEESADGARSPKSYRPNDFVAEDKLQRKVAVHLNKYYDKVIGCIHDADAILILGPGEAKLEFKKRIVGKKLKLRIAELEAADKRTDRQIVADVRQYFAKQHSI
jgi:hypothetical protein